MTWKDAAGLGILCFFVFGCAASPETLIMINKSITITNPKGKVDLKYSTKSGVTSAAEFDGEISPDIEVTR